MEEVTFKIGHWSLFPPTQHNLLQGHALTWSLLRPQIRTRTWQTQCLFLRRLDFTKDTVLHERQIWCTLFMYCYLHSSVTGQTLWAAGITATDNGGRCSTLPLKINFVMCPLYHIHFPTTALHSVHSHLITVILWQPWSGVYYKLVKARCQETCLQCAIQTLPLCVYITACSGIT